MFHFMKKILFLDLVTTISSRERNDSYLDILANGSADNSASLQIEQNPDSTVNILIK